MNNYVDGFVLVVPNSKIEEYKKMAEMGRDMWIKAGAIGYYECRGDDMKAKNIGGFCQYPSTGFVSAGQNGD